MRVDIIEQRQTNRVKLGPGRPGVNSQYQEREIITYQIQWTQDKAAIAKAQRTDGLFPLVDNTKLSPVDVLVTYKNQPYLEKRFHTTKSVLEVAPVFLKTPRRIEAMMFLYFIALMLVSLMERKIRGQMQNDNIDSLPIRPSGLKTKMPTWENLQYFFRNVHLAIVIQNERILATRVKGISPLHALLLRLLKVPRSIYEQLTDRWWLFAMHNG
jgi:transposase